MTGKPVPLDLREWVATNLLRRWHDQSDPASEQDRETMRAAMREQAREAAVGLESTAEHLNAEQRALVQAASRELPELAEQLPLVYQHGDYSTRNWLWDAAPGRPDGLRHLHRRHRRRGRLRHRRRLRRLPRCRAPRPLGR
ncbi:MAG TPA: phosphotransferase [Pseudonocardiaceae bacterium]|nr:phosphotransferase [Pseudonocardiaceae bacterium]